MSLKPEVSLPVALATAAVVYAVYSQATPTIADIRTAQPGDSDVDGARKGAAWIAAGAVAAISLISKDINVFIVGGGMVVAMDWWTRHADTVSPLTKGLTDQASGGISVDDMTQVPADMGTVYDYSAA